MRKFDKKLNINKANILSEQRYLATKGLIKETIDEEYFESRKPVNGYVDAEDLLGETVWVHTNFTHRNHGQNGMVGIYRPNSVGYKTGSPIGYTNEIRISGSLVFEQSEKAAARVKTSQLKQVIAGVSGVVIPTDAGNTSGMDLAVYNAKEGLGYFHLANGFTDIPKKIIGGDEVYFFGNEAGNYSFYVKNPIFEGNDEEEFNNNEL